jgi:charged multivesicular body protein 3
MNFFGQPVQKEDPLDQAKRWKREITREARRLDRDISAIERAEKKAMKDCQKYAKKGEMKAAKTLAKEIVNTRHARERIRLTQVQMNSIASTLQQNISMIKVQGCISKSTEVMHAMNKIINIPELRQNMTSLAREMEKAGMIDEIMNDTFEMIEPEDLGNEADKEVDRLMEELTAGVLDKNDPVPTNSGPVKQTVQQEEETEKEEVNEEENEELKKMQERLQSL